MGGYRAEKIKFGEITTGAVNDLERATKIVRKLVREYGISSLIEKETIEREEFEKLIGGDPFKKTETLESLPKRGKSAKIKVEIRRV